MYRLVAIDLDGTMLNRYGIVTEKTKQVIEQVQKNQIEVIIASGNKVAIGDTLTKAITNLLSQSAVDIQIDTTEDVQSLIKAIINANNNLTESNNRNDWEMMGTDLKELQELKQLVRRLINILVFYIYFLIHTNRLTHSPLIKMILIHMSCFFFCIFAHFLFLPILQLIYLLIY